MDSSGKPAGIDGDRPMSREQIHSRIAAIKRGIVVGTLVAFGAISGLVAGHVTGVTAQSGAPVQPAVTNNQPADSGGFFNGGDDNGGGIGPGGGDGGNSGGPVVGSGGS